MAIKSKELAGMLGVSTATMSLVLNHKPGISDELRSSLLARIQEMGYGYMIKEEPQELQEGSPAPMKNIAYLVMSDYQDEGMRRLFSLPLLRGRRGKRGTWAIIFPLSICMMKRAAGSGTA